MFFCISLVRAIAFAQLAAAAAQDAAPAATPDLVSISNLDSLLKPQIMLVELDKAIQDVMEDRSSRDSHEVSQLQLEREGFEKTRLLERMNRKTGDWGGLHPRHRLLDALHGFHRYYDRQNEEIKRLKGLYKKVTKAQKKLLEQTISYSRRFGQLQHLLTSNQVLCDKIVDAGLAFYDIPRSELDKHIKDSEKKGKAEKVSVSQSLKHIVRDWTTSGLKERNSTFLCMLGKLNELFPERMNGPMKKVLLPGAGLGRLGHDVAAMNGFDVVTNEWSMYMNLIYRYLTSSDAVTKPNATIFHPFLDSYSHHVSINSQARSIAFPDTSILPSAVLLKEGDFTTAFSNDTETYDVVLTYFFIDTARNIMAYLETIRRVLKPGGHWINLGPLLWGSAPFAQLTLEDIITVSESIGFEFLDTADDSGCGVATFGGKKTVRSMEAIYSFDDEALTTSAYKAQFWIARLQQ